MALSVTGIAKAAGGVTPTHARDRTPEGSRVSTQQRALCPSSQAEGLPVSHTEPECHGGPSCDLSGELHSSCVHTMALTEADTLSPVVTPRTPHRRPLYRRTPVGTGSPALEEGSGDCWAHGSHSNRLQLRVQEALASPSSWLRCISVLCAHPVLRWAPLPRKVVLGELSGMCDSLLRLDRRRLPFRTANDRGHWDSC